MIKDTKKNLFNAENHLLNRWCMILLSKFLKTKFLKHEQKYFDY